MSGYQTESYYARGPRPSNPSFPSQLTNLTAKFGKFSTVETDQLILNDSLTGAGFYPVYQLQNLVGTSNVFPESGVPEIQSFVNSQFACSVGQNAILGQDRNGVANKFYGVYYGNAYSGQEFFYGTGAANANGDLINEDQIFATASSAKVIGGMTLCKLLEEQYFDANETIASYVPEFSGIGYYLTSSTGTMPAGNVLTVASNDFTGPSFADWTGTLGTVNLSTLTIAQAMSLQIPHASYSFYQLGFFNQLSFNNWKAATAATNTDFSWSYSQYLAKIALDRGMQLGATAACQDPQGASLRSATYNFYFDDTNFCTGPYTDALQTAIATIKSGKVPLSYLPGAGASDGITITTQSKETYSEFGWLLMMAVATKALQLKSGGKYSNLIEYTQDKIFAPMNITASFAIVQPAISGTYIEQCFRRGPSLCQGYAASGASSTYASTFSNGLAFVSQYPDDGMYKLSYNGKNVFRRDPIGWNLTTGIFMSIKDYVKVLKMIANKGVYEGTRVMTRTAINYLMTPLSNSSSIFELGSGMDYNSPNSQWCFGFMKLGGGNYELNFASQASEFYQVDNIMTYGRTPNQIYWNGITDNSWMLDLDTGNYAFTITFQTGICYRVLQGNASTTIARRLAKYI